jgi:hypothetical protein
MCGQTRGGSLDSACLLWLRLDLVVVLLVVGRLLLPDLTGLGPNIV